MATPQLSPGVVVREVDLTVGRADNVLANIGAIAGPFKIGPVEEAIDITTEQDLINTFGKPLSTDRQYEYWLSASSFLSYGGVLKVARADGATLNNANAITLTIPSGLGDGFNCLIVQKGAGQITLSASGTTLINRQSHTKTAGQYAVVSIVNIGSDNIIVGGDTGS